MNIVVIGSKGFIGTHLLKKLRDDGHLVFGCDVIQDPADPQYFQFHSAETGFEEIFVSQQFDVCFNCSGSASVPFSFEHPSVDFQLNVSNLFLLLEAVRKNNPECRIIQLSSAAVYGNPETLPVRTDSKMAPVSIYGFHKKMAEEICHEFHQIYGVPVIIARIFSAYGDGLRKQLFWDLYQKTKSGKQIELFGTGNESRDFIFIGDLIRSLIILMEKGNFQATVYNLASGKQISVREAAQSFLNCYAPDSILRFTGNARSGDPVGWEADISDLKSLGFIPQVSFDSGIKKYADWLRNEK